MVGGEGRLHGFRMMKLFGAFLVFACVLLAGTPALAAPLTDPLRFFEGHTETDGVVNVIMKKPRHVRNVGRGTISADGSLSLVQQVREEGKAPKERVWHIRKVGPNKFAGTMSDAVGPVTIEQVGDRYRFRFKLAGGLSAEQWVTPNAEGSAGRSVLTVRKLGITVARSVSTIRRTPKEARSSP